MLVTLLLTLALYLSGFFVFLTPLPLLYRLLRNERRIVLEALGAGLVLLLLLYLFLLPPLAGFYQKYPGWAWLLPVPGMNWLQTLGQGRVVAFGMTYFLFFAGTAFILKEVFSDSKRLVRTVGCGSVLFFGLSVILYLVLSALSHVPPQEWVHGYFRSTIHEFISIQKEAALPLDQIAFLKENGERLVNYSVLVSPALLFGTILLIIVLNAAMARRLFAPLTAKTEKVLLSAWSMPFGAVWVVIGSIALLLAHSYLRPMEWAIPVGANLLIVLAVVYYLQGLSIVVYYLELKQAKPLLRLLIYSLILFLFQTLGLAIMALGFFDSWFNFRKLPSRMEKKEKKPF